MKKQPTSRMCFICGERNPAGLHMRFYEQDDGSLLGKFTGLNMQVVFGGVIYRPYFRFRPNQAKIDVDSLQITESPTGTRTCSIESRSRIVTLPSYFSSFGRAD